MKKCPKCNMYGESEDTRFCPGCGTELFFEKRFDGINFPDTAIKRKRRMSIVIALVVLIIIGVIIYLSMQ